MKKILLVLMLAFGATMADEKGESYYSYFEKGNEAFLAKDYKQAENYYKKACEKQAPNDYSAFKDFRQNCNAHSAMEYFDKVCSNGDGYYYMEKICMQVGDMYYKGNKEVGVEKNIPLAKKYWAEALNKIICGNFGDCISEWVYDTILSYLEGREKTEFQKEIKPDYTKARLLAEIACEKGRTFDDNKPIGQACEILGDIYAQGKGVKQDLNKAKNLYQKACENPSNFESSGRGGIPCGGGYQTSEEHITHFGCKQLGDIYYLGKNFTEAKKWWAKAFDVMYLNDERYISSAYYQEAEGYYNGSIIKGYKFIEKGTYVKHEQDYTKAILLARIGCNDFKDFKSCSILVNAFTQGKGTKQNLNLAQHYLTKANQYEAKVLYERARQLGYQICGWGDGEYIEFPNDKNQAQAVAKQRVQIKELLQKACNLDKTNQACTDLKNKSYENWSGYDIYKD